MKLTSTASLQAYVDAVVAVKRAGLLPRARSPVAVTDKTTIADVKGLEQFFFAFTDLEPKTKLKGRIRSCYKWALMAALADHNMVYCEGYALPKSLGVPVLHAWCVDKITGVVHDPTWKRDNRGDAYIGLPMQAEFVTDTVLKNRYYGILDNMWLHRDLTCTLYNMVHPQYHDKVFNSHKC